LFDMTIVQTALAMVMQPDSVRDRPVNHVVGDGEQARQDRDLNRLCNSMTKSNRDGCSTGRSSG
jgi:hypothetical protein